MRNLFWLFLALSCSPAARADDALILRLEQLEQRVGQLEQRLRDLEHAPRLPVPAEESNKPLPEPVEGHSSAPALRLGAWSYREVQIKFNTYYALDLELHNGYAKAIKEIEGRVQFHSLLGNHLYSIALTQDIHIPPGGSVVDQGTQQNKRLLGEGHPMRNLKSPDIVAELVIKKIVFDDNTRLSF